MGNPFVRHIQVGDKRIRLRRLSGHHKIPPVSTKGTAKKVAKRYREAGCYARVFHVKGGWAVYFSRITVERKRRVS